MPDPHTRISLDDYRKRKSDTHADSGPSKRIPPITQPVPAPSAPALATPTFTVTNELLRSPAKTMDDAHQDTDMQASEPPAQTTNQQPSGTSPPPRRPGLDEIRDECNPQVLYAQDSLFWASEADLFPTLTNDEIQNIEEEFAQSTNILHFHLNPDEASRWNIVNFREEIVSDCKYFFDITFQTPLSGNNSVLTGIPNERHIEAWSAAKRGYLLLSDDYDVFPTCGQ
ncbi:unnamed protein product [Aphanomyces euteiches]